MGKVETSTLQGNARPPVATGRDQSREGRRRALPVIVRFGGRVGVKTFKPRRQVRLGRRSKVYEFVSSDDWKPPLAPEQC